jgi:hypothetical protein
MESKCLVKTVQYSAKMANKKDDYSSCSVSEYEAECKKLKSCFERIIDDGCVKLYFDIDYKGLVSGEEQYEESATDEIIRIAKKAITKQLKVCSDVEPVFCVKTACSENYTSSKDGLQYWAISIHIIVVNFVATKKTQNAMISHWNEILDNTDYKDYLPHSKKFFDESIYDTNRKLRSAFCTKPAEQRFFNLVEGSFADSIISVYNSDAIAPFKEPVSTANKVIEKVETDNVRFNIIKKFCEHKLFNSHLDTHIKWMSFGGMLISIFNEKEALELWGLCSITDAKKTEYVSQFKYLQPFENPDKVYNILCKWAKESDKKLHDTIMAESKQHGELLATNDDDASNLIIEKLNGDLIYVKGQYFLRVNHVWKCDDIDSYILVFIQRANIRKPTKDDSKPYSQNISEAKHIRESLYAKIKIATPSNIYDKFHTTTKNRLCFLDGVLDFKTKKFVIWDEIDFEYYSTVQINRNFGDYFKTPDHSVMKTIDDNIVKMLFGKNIKGMQFLARAIAGNCEDKNWASYLGKRDCGKGVLYDLLESSFGDYIKTFQLGNIMCQRNSKVDNSEISRKLYWLLDYQFSRLAISQEVPTPEDKMKMNGEMIKKLAGGGDNHVARRNYDRVDTTFKIDTTWFALGNDEIEVDCEDVNEHRLQFASVTTFKTQTEIDKMREEGASELLLASYRVKDDSVKDRCKTDYWANAFVMLIFNAWENKAVDICIEKSDSTVSSLRERLLEKYTITCDNEDIMLVTSITDEFSTDNKKKINTELESFGIVKKKHKKAGDFKDKWCYYGLKPIE